ncbi:hypothetical protein CSB37_02410 [bacterium DOLZORAL124_38_8]|nr:MAG: hypothetical protein CSB37_02410 [bacterium DOLZORAL124_38_8]
MENKNNNIVFDLQQSIQTNKGANRPQSLKDWFDKINDWMIRASGVPLQEQLVFFQLLSTLVNAGVSLLESLQLLKSQTNNLTLKTIIDDVKNDIGRGYTLSNAFRQHPSVFDEATCAIVEAGENSGKLSELLKELVKQKERSSTLKKKVKSAMMYPVTVISVMILLGVVMIVVIVPKLEGLFQGADNLPLPTRIMIGMSDFLQNYWYLLIGGLVVLFLGFKQWQKTPSGQSQLSQIILKIPVIGNFVVESTLGRISRILGFLISAGVPIIGSLQIASDVAGNPIYKQRIQMAINDLKQGIEISENFSDDESLFPSMFVRMISIGEKTSSLGSIMNKMADYYDEAVERKIGTISKLMEPIIVLFMAVGAVFFILAIYLPIMKLNDTIG